MHFVEADIKYGSAYLTGNNNKVYRVWIGDHEEPLMELLTPLQMAEWEGFCAMWPQRRSRLLERLT